MTSPLELDNTTGSANWFPSLNSAFGRQRITHMDGPNRRRTMQTVPDLQIGRFGLEKDAFERSPIELSSVTVPVIASLSAPVTAPVKR